MKSEGIVYGYKATDKNMQCRGYQFEFGVWHKHDGVVAMCESGFHFCEYPSGPWSFYSDATSRIFRVEARGVLMGNGPGADLKHVATEIRLIEEIICSGDGNTGDGNTGDRNTGNRNTGNRNTGDGNTGNINTGYGNTGDGNTGDGNTGNINTGDGNTGYSNTGNSNTGHINTGNRNTGDRNTGNRNTGNRNTGDGNCTDNCSGFLCSKEQPVRIFDAIVKDQSCVDYGLIAELSEIISIEGDMGDIEKFLAIPNSSIKKIKKLHELHIKKRLLLKGKK